MLFNKRHCKRLLVLAVLVSTASFSAVPLQQHQSMINYVKSLNPAIALHLGAFNAMQGSAQHVNITNLIGDDFSVTHSSDSNALIGAGLYINGYETQFVHLLYGIDAFYFPQTQVNGKVTQEGLFTNLSYRYYVTNIPIYLAAKVLFTHSFHEKMAVTFDAGIGPNIIQASDFSEQSLDGGVTKPDQIFSSRNSTDLSIMAGVGLKFDNVFGKLPLECGYRFFYLGQGQLNKANSQVTTQLNTGYSKANALLCSIMFS